MLAKEQKNVNDSSCAKHSYFVVMNIIDKTEKKKKNLKRNIEREKEMEIKLLLYVTRDFRCIYDH